MNVHPSSSVIPVAPTTSEPFAPEARYEIKIRRDDNPAAEITYRVTVSPGDGSQVATLRRFEGTGDAGRVIAERVPVSTGRDANIVEALDYRIFAGRRSDPFFFDTLGALDNLKFTGNDFFTDKDVCSIVLEVPNAAIGVGTVGLWMRVLVPSSDARGGWAQVERGGRPQHAVFLAGEARDAYQAGDPTDDARFVPVFAHSLEHAGGYAPAEAKRVAEKLLPDLLRYDPADRASYPKNGRLLTDDVTSVFLPILSNGKVTGDNVGPHRDLLDEFPYLGPPHRA